MTIYIAPKSKRSKALSKNENQNKGAKEYERKFFKRALRPPRSFKGRTIRKVME